MARKFLTPIDLNKLELQNAVIQNLATDPASPAQGQIYYNSVSDLLKVYDGTAWFEVGALSTEAVQDIVAGVIVAGSGVSSTYNDSSNTLTIANTGVTGLTGTADEVTVSASAGAVTVSLPATINANTTGTAASLTTARNIALTGDVTGTLSFDGSASASMATTIAANSVALGTDTTGNYVATAAAGSGIDVSGSGSETAALTITNTGVTSLLGTADEVTVSASAGAVTLSLPATINANTTGTAASLTTARTIELTGDVTGTLSFDGSASASMATTIAANSVALGTDTTGNYVATITGTANEIEVSGSGSETASVTIGLPDDVTIGNLTVSGALTVSGSATYINTEIVTINDNIILLNNNEAGTPSANAGIEVERGTSTNTSILWNETSDVWTLSNDGTNYHGITRKHSASVGNGAATSIAVTHNLNSRDVAVDVYDNSTYETVECDVVRTDANVVTVSFAAAPTSNAYRVVIVG